jgi:hypothetical protein
LSSSSPKLCALARGHRSLARAGSLEPVMHFCPCLMGQRPGDKPAQGNALGEEFDTASPEGARQTLPPIQGWFLRWHRPRALPWAGLFAHLGCSCRGAGVHDKALAPPHKPCPWRECTLRSCLHHPGLQPRHRLPEAKALAWESTSSPAAFGAEPRGKGAHEGREPSRERVVGDASEKSAHLAGGVGVI